jgi:cation transport protein ChaC
MDEMWVFGYGSLIWNPEFAVAERQIARATHWRRSFCMWSIHHRGSIQAPGLVLALDHVEGAVCDGVAFRVAAGTEDETLAALRARELISSAYQEVTMPLALQDGRSVNALAYVIDPEHEQYCANLCCQPRQISIGNAQFGQMISGGKKIVAVGAAPARGACDDFGLFGQSKAAAILLVLGVNHIGQGVNATPILQSKRHSNLLIC